MRNQCGDVPMQGIQVRAFYRPQMRATDLFVWGKDQEGGFYNGVLSFVKLEQNVEGPPAISVEDGWSERGWQQQLVGDFANLGFSATPTEALLEASEEQLKSKDEEIARLYKLLERAIQATPPPPVMLRIDNAPRVLGMVKDALDHSYDMSGTDEGDRVVPAFHVAILRALVEAGGPGDVRAV